LKEKAEKETRFGNEMLGAKAVFINNTTRCSLSFTLLFLESLQWK